jgi:hypothetical protein
VDFLNDKKSVAVAALGEKRFTELICIPQPHLVESYILPEKTVKYSFNPNHKDGEKKYYTFRDNFGFGANAPSTHTVLELALNNLANPSEFLFKCTLKEIGFNFEYCYRLVSSTDPNNIFYLIHGFPSENHVWHLRFFENDRGVLQPDPVASLFTIYLNKGSVDRKNFCERKQKAIPTITNLPTQFTLRGASSYQ